MNINELVGLAAENKASDVHITVGVPPILRINGELIHLDRPKLSSQDTLKLVYQTIDSSLIPELEEKGEIDTSYSYTGVGRYRVNVYRQRGSYGMAMRVIPNEVPSMRELGLPAVLKDFARLPRGLILIVGPTGSGKSTTLATMIDQINEEKPCHIVTIEDPIEYLHKHKKAVINQRELGLDTMSFSNSLRAALRQDPDVILVGEMRDLETISTALTAAETGHLVLSTLHTVGSAKTIDRIIDVFPPHQQQQVRVQLSSVLEAVVSQQLLPKLDESGRCAAFEVMVGTPAIKNLIREGKAHQIDTAIQTGSKFKMQTMDSNLLELHRNGLISKDTAIAQAMNQDEMKRNLF